MRKGLILRGRLPFRGGGCGTELGGGGAEFALFRAFSADGARASLCAWNGLRKTVFCFLGAEVGFVMGELA